MNEHLTEYSPSPEPGVSPLFVFACGAVTGTVLATLLAPAAGRDTRARLASGVRAVRDRGRQAAARSRHTLRQHADRIDTFVDDARRGVRDARDRVAAAVGSRQPAPGDASREAVS
jgi:hypothetical protein